MRRSAWAPLLLAAVLLGSAGTATAADSKTGDLLGRLRPGGEKSTATQKPAQPQTAPTEPAAKPPASRPTSPTPTQDSVTILVSPVRLELLGDPGESIDATVALTNAGRANLRLSGSALDVASVDDAGRPMFGSSASEPWAMSPWIKPSPRTLNLKPGESRTVRVRIDIPKNAEPGGHYGAVLYGTDSNAKERTSIVAEVGTLLLLTVSGDIVESGRVSLGCPWCVEPGALNLPVKMFNTGNVHAAGDGEVVVETFSGDKVTSLPVAIGNVLPGASRVQQAVWKDARRVGVYWVQARMNIGESGAPKLSDRRWVVVFPWRLALAAVGVFLLGVATALAILRRRPRTAE